VFIVTILEGVPFGTAIPPATTRHSSWVILVNASLASFARVARKREVELDEGDETYGKEGGTLVRVC
jgi:hypothetical protein